VELGDDARISGDTFLLVSDVSRRAFVAWATDNGLVGRWVELEEKEGSETFREKPESGKREPARVTSSVPHGSTGRDPW